MELTSSIAELAKACSKEAHLNVVEAISLGELVWFRGTAVSAPPGTVALMVAGGFQVVIKESDVVKVLKENDEFHVQVSADANVLVRFEKVVKARSNRATSSECGCKDSDAPVPSKMEEKSIARQRNDGTIDDCPPFERRYWIYECTVEIDWRWFGHRFYGIPIMKCGWTSFCGPIT